MLKETFSRLLSEYTDDIALSNSLWAEVEAHYTAQGRYYHTLRHLEHLLQQLDDIRALLQNRNAVLFSLYYHDIIYDPLRNDNEEQSALLAIKRMQQLAVPGDTIARCKAHIMATKTHIKSEDADTNYFTDADLSILGQSREVYEQYYKDVRNEYAVYPDALYIPRRKKVLEHFMAMERIFKTAYFYDRFEEQAKQNLHRESELL